MLKIDFRKDVAKILIGFSIAGVIVNGYFAASGNFPPPESFPGMPELRLTFKIACFAVALLSIIAGTLIYLFFLKEGSEKAGSKDISKMSMGFFIALLLPSLKLKIYPLVGVSLILIFVFTYISFFREQ